MKVYITHKGEYSDYHIVGVYSTEENAKAAIDAGFGDDFFDTEIDKGVDQIKQGLKSFKVNMFSDGSEADAGISSDIPCNDFAYYLYPDDRKWCYFTCWAKDKKHAIKIMNEKRIQKIANNEL
jgi:hypothetical protein